MHIPRRDAEIIGSIDADYVLHPDWLKDLVPLFADASVGFVQSPQDHRDGDRSVMHAAMNAEYSGFFDIGMWQRNEINAIVMHGTMCLIRRAAIESTGGWSSDTIVEDTDLGLAYPRARLERALHQPSLRPWTSSGYVRGLPAPTAPLGVRRLPTSAQALAQAVAWRRGAHVASKSANTASAGSTGSARTRSGVVVALLNIVWVPVVAFANIAVPDRILTLPIIAAFTVSVAHFVALDRLRVKATPGQMAGAVCAAMSLQWTVARAVATGVLNERVPFLRTAKGGVGRKGADFGAFWEAVISALLLVGALTLVVTNYKQVHEINIFAFVLVVQSLPVPRRRWLGRDRGHPL